MRDLTALSLKTSVTITPTGVFGYHTQTMDSTIGQRVSMRGRRDCGGNRQNARAEGFTNP
jgi:hypothetical protein